MQQVAQRRFRVGGADLQPGQDGGGRLLGRAAAILHQPCNHQAGKELADRADQEGRARRDFAAVEIAAEGAVMRGAIGGDDAENAAGEGPRAGQAGIGLRQRIEQRSVGKRGGRHHASSQRSRVRARSGAPVAPSGQGPVVAQQKGVGAVVDMGPGKGAGELVEIAGGDLPGVGLADQRIAAIGDARGQHRIALLPQGQMPAGIAGNRAGARHALGKGSVV